MITAIITNADGTEVLDAQIGFGNGWMPAIAPAAGLAVYASEHDCDGDRINVNAEGGDAKASAGVALIHPPPPPKKRWGH